MTFNLRAKAEDETTVGIGMQVPGLAGQHRRAARKRDDDGRGQFQTLRRQGRQGQRRQRVVAEFDRHDGVEAGGFRPGGGGPGFAPVPQGHHGEYAHGSNVRYREQNRHDIVSPPETLTVCPVI